MLPNKRKEKSIISPDEGIVWKHNFWQRKTTIYYAKREVGFLELKGVFGYKAHGELLDRPFRIKKNDFWSSDFIIMDEINKTPIALLVVNLTFGQTRLYIGDEVFIYNANVWGTGTWWWQRVHGTKDEREEKLIKTWVSDYFRGKGLFRFGETKESNLNALILGGLYVSMLSREMNGG